MTRGRELLLGAILALFGVVFALGALELGVRMMHLVPDRFWEPDAELGVRLTPKQRGWWTQEEREFVVPIQISSQGLRDVEHAYDKPDGVFRILVLGDSFVEAMHVPQEAVFTRQLESQLNGAAHRVEVIGAGVSGYGTAGELLYLRRDGKRFQPDLVILSFYPGNDVKNNSPVFEDTLRPVYGADGSLERVVGDKKKSAGGLLGRSKAYQFLRQLLLQRQPALAQRLVGLGLLRADAIRKPPVRDGVPVDFGVYASPPSAEWQDAWQRTERLLDEMRADVTASGARFAVMIVSTRDQVYPASWQQIVSANPAMQGKAWNLDAPQLRVETWCREHGVPYLAMAPLFKAAAGSQPEPLHFAQDGHWTPAGHGLAAAKLSDFILANSLLKTEQEGVRP